MPTVATVIKVEEAHVTRDLQETCERLQGDESEVVLDLSSVWRIDTAGVNALAQLATRAEEKGVKLMLRGVSVEVYKVLTLMNLAPRFSFVK